MNPVEHQLLNRIISGHLRMRDGQIENYHFQNRKWITKKPNYHPISGRARYAFGNNGSRTTVYRNRLVWMLTHKKEIPDTHFVDHEDGNRFNDDPDNLKLMPRDESHRQGNDVVTNSVLGQLCRWFDFVSTVGREPEHPHEVSWVEVGF